jgi:hypothetical protein
LDGEFLERGGEFASCAVSLYVVEPFAADTPFIEPYPDALLEELGDAPRRPRARVGFDESMTLAFVAALQRLSPQQRTVIALHDVMGFDEVEVGKMVELHPDEVRRTLACARAILEDSLPQAGAVRAPTPHSRSERRIVQRFARAYERGDVDRLAAVLTDDATLTTPPDPAQYRGRDAVAAFLRARCDHRAGRRTRLLATRANTQPAFACYLENPHAPVAHAYGLIVLTLKRDRIAAITRFLDTGLLASFGLPRTLSR